MKNLIAIATLAASLVLPAAAGATTFGNPSDDGLAAVFQQPVITGSGVVGEFRAAKGDPSEYGVASAIRMNDATSGAFAFRGFVNGGKVLYGGNPSDNGLPAVLQ